MNSLSLGMRISLKQLKKMTVETLSGVKLGRVHDIFFGAQEQMILQYVVKPSGIGGESYLIGRDQVVRFEEKTMVVYDTALKRKEKENIPPMKILPESGMAMRDPSV